MSLDKSQPAGPLAEPLSRRERDILSLLAQEHSAAEIAQSLTLAVSSVRWYIQQLYRKLGVNRKRQAITRARELGLLPASESAVTGTLPRMSAPSVPERKHNLPVQFTRFFGREDELASLIQRLAEYRLVTLTGSGGVGKTRLSLQGAEELVDQFSGGVWLVELAPLTDAALVPQHVAVVLGVGESPGRSPLENLLVFLRGRQMLLVLDNCEHLLAACARLVEALLHATPGLKVLASSREPLGITGEAIFDVRPLPFPDPAHLPHLEQLSAYTAIRLFVDRARLVVADYRVAEHNALPLARICHRLDGIPLAIEMAAARVNILTATNLAERLDDSFRVLTSGSRTALPRQQTLRATMDWSYELLSGAERRLLQSLSVFAGSCALEAAEAVCSEDASEGGEVLERLASLAARSMVIPDRRQGEETRYRLLEMVRQYAHERLLESKSEESVQRRHLAYFLALAEQAGPEPESEQQRMVRLDRLEAERDNLRAALGWAVDNDVEAAVRLAGALSSLWLSRGYGYEGCEWLERALTAEAQARRGGPLRGARALARANALLQLGYVIQWNKGTKYSIPWLEEGLVLLRELGPAARPRLASVLMVLATWAIEQGDLARATALKAECLSLLPEKKGDNGKAESLYILAHFAQAEGDFERARVMYEESLAVLKNLGVRHGLWSALYELGQLAVLQGDDHRAIALHEEILAVAREMRSGVSINSAQSELAHIERRLGHDAQALALYAQTIVVWKEIGQPAAVAHELECFAFIARAQTQAQRAARLLGAAEALRESINSPMTAGERVEYDREVSALRAQMAETAFASAWTEGWAMTSDQATAYALETTTW